METDYNGLRFPTPLAATWAAFFDLAGWTWHCNPSPVGNWLPDFQLTFECEHSECPDHHTLLAAVLPYSKIEDFKNHPCLKCMYGSYECSDGRQVRVLADGGAAFGKDPSVTQWQISHGAGGGIEDIYFRVPNADELWAKALAQTSSTQLVG